MQNVTRTSSCEPEQPVIAKVVMSKLAVDMLATGTVIFISGSLESNWRGARSGKWSITDSAMK
ncbi:MAG: hypothetical protein DIZ77_11910 [endosymbiont of Seepiophila jonesi]|nr:MAG: hypothetical protein DIZ77_11910 [endosymbiont of Seepiophila jonesi]